MSNTYTAIFERDGEWYIVTARRYREPMAKAVRKRRHGKVWRQRLALIFEDRREDAPRTPERRRARDGDGHGSEAPCLFATSDDTAVI